MPTRWSDWLASLGACVAMIIIWCICHRHFNVPDTQTPYWSNYLIAPHFDYLARQLIINAFLVREQYVAIHTNHVINIWWSTLTIWTVWIDTIYTDPFWSCGHHELTRHIVIYSGHVHSMDQCNISWYTLNMCTAWINAIYRDPYRPRGQHNLIQYMVIHSDHVGNICGFILIRWTVWIDTAYAIHTDHVGNIW